jgi:hypothetical protein
VRTGSIVVGLLLAVAGAIWVAQGLNLPFAPRSFMTRDLTWTAIGAIAMLVGIGLVAWGWQRAPR